MKEETVMKNKSLWSIVVATLALVSPAGAVDTGGRLRY